MVDELSEAEHSTFTITPKQEECLQAGNVWEIVDSWDGPKSKIEEIAAYYGLTYSRVMRWKKYWMKLIGPKNGNDEYEGISHFLTSGLSKFSFARSFGDSSFNVFSATNIATDEVRHSSFLTELIRPNGSNKHARPMLKRFFELMPEARRLGLEPSRCIVRTEVPIGMIHENTGGRIDILITDGKKAIIIENKIYAADQDHQLERYYAYGKANYQEGFLLYYLTLTDSHKPSSQSKGRLVEEKDFWHITYRDDIKDWLETCIKELLWDKEALFYILEQYIDIIKQLTMREDTIDQICADMDYAGSLAILLDNHKTFERRLIEQYLIAPLSDYYNQEEWEVQEHPSFHKDILIAFRPKEMAGSGLWHVVQRPSNSGCGYYGLCVDEREVAKNQIEQSQYNHLCDGINDKFPHGWKTLQMTLEVIVAQTYFQEINVLVSETTRSMES